MHRKECRPGQEPPLRRRWPSGRGHRKAAPASDLAKIPSFAGEKGGCGCEAANGGAAGGSKTAAVC